jgi:hypothetical protein
MRQVSDSGSKQLTCDMKDIVHFPKVKFYTICIDYTKVFLINKENGFNWSGGKEEGLLILIT